MLHLPDFSQPLSFLLLTLAMFAVVMGRFVLIAGLFHLAFFVWFPHKWQQRRLAAKQVPQVQLRREIGWSFATSLLFALAGAVTVVLWQKGFTRVYTNPGQYGVWYLPVSLVLSMLIHETYYYWLHRWMHKPRIFKWIHKVHHDSKTTSPWTAFSFHPLEGFLQAIILPLTILFLPMHYYVLLLQLTIMTFSSIINHLEVEVYPSAFEKNVVAKWLIGATHHSLHHKQFKYNFGLYFTFWDKWVKTESPKFSQVFREKTKGKAMPEKIR